MSRMTRNLTRIFETLYAGVMIGLFLFGLISISIVLVSKILAEGWTLGTLICFPFWLLMVTLTVFTIALWIRDTLNELASLATMVFTH
jgi:uncharacterized membrane protein